MCRMAILPKGYNGEKVVALLDHLERAMGGDGNGFGFFDADGVGQVVKGLKVKNETINKIEPAGEVVLYHTRKASAGETSDANTQPFLTKDKDKKQFMLCHNGTWTSHTDYKKILLMLGKITVEAYQTWSDTRFMAWLIEHQGEDRLELPGSGVWIQAYPEHAIVHVRSGDWQAIKLGKKWLFASEFPKTKDYPKVWEFESDSVVFCSPENGFKVLAGPKGKQVDNTAYVTTYDAGYWEKNKKVYGVGNSTKMFYYDKEGKKKELVSSIADEYTY